MAWKLVYLLFWFLETGSHFVAKASLELTILLSQSLEV